MFASLFGDIRANFIVRICLFFSAVNKVFLFLEGQTLKFSIFSGAGEKFRGLLQKNPLFIFSQDFFTNFGEKCPISSIKLPKSYQFSFFNFQNLLVIDCLHQFLIGPIYLASLASIRAQPNTLLISRVTCLFLFAQFLKIIQETETIQNVLTSLFFGDINDIKTEWVRTLSDGISLAMLRKWDKSVERFS